MVKRESNFRELLDANYCWPCSFPFKFIVPADKLDEILGLFSGEEYACRPSRTGKYVSVTIHKNVCSSEEVAQIYERVGKTEGAICL
jgi:putative lipoic acid-binding regulatory protein